MNVELNREELDMLISSLEHWKSNIVHGTPSSPAEVGPEAYLARQKRLAPVEELLHKLRNARRSAS